MSTAIATITLKLTGPDITLGDLMEFVRDATMHGLNSDADVSVTPGPATIAITGKVTHPE